MTFETQESLKRILHRSARYLDDQNYSAFLDLFTDKADYSITCLAPELQKKMIWMQRSRDELAERIAAMNEHEWEIACVQQTRIISVDTILITGNAATTSTSFSLYHTLDDGSSELYVLGRYEDEWLNSDDSWLISNREVALRTRKLKLLSPLPV
ncbi:MAG: SnoaL-like domain-containing protein [Gammaproteobacteria bacterium]|jgi:3-phenylpropionate/cinnamic acid dioxygenase small subunit|nr:SnoaL-like domain-containing protein [Gammaproteobacteria bacterium]